jgi:hypothetical protein
MKMTKSLLATLTITLALAGHVKAQSFLTTGLIAYYPFNGNANDATTNGNNGIIVGDVILATDRFGNASNAYHFDGSDAMIEVTNTVLNLGQAGYTISGWFYFDSPIKQCQSIFNTIPETGIGVSYTCGNEADAVQWAVGSGIGWTVLNEGGIKTNYASQTWYQMIFTKSGALYTSYINGQVDGQYTNSAESGYNYGVGYEFGSVGATYAVSEGRLDDFRVYDRALSTNEIQQLYAYESVPEPAHCIPFPATATATATNGFVIAATVTDGGCGYTNTPLVQIVGGGGSGATAMAIVTNGVVVGIEITDAGIGYTSAPIIYISSPLGVQIGILQAVIPTLSGLSIGSNYQLQASGDLTTWTDQGSVFTATNGTLIYPQYFNVTNFNQLFFRLQAAP